ncbi:MAG: LON peptidase substrate-binding domain-containing protein [Chthoniobacterales bacterium]
MNKAVTLPDRAPVMPLPGVLLFPNALLPLHIFEPRYRAMLDYALVRDRIFCVALIKPSRSDWKSTSDFFHVAGVGLIRACVGGGDGTSNLILQGLKRVQLKDLNTDAEFPIARIEPLDSRISKGVEVDALGAKILELYSDLKKSGRQFPAKLDRYLDDLSDPEMLADLMAASFITMRCAVRRSSRSWW